MSYLRSVETMSDQVPEMESETHFEPQAPGLFFSEASKRIQEAVTNASPLSLAFFQHRVTDRDDIEAILNATNPDDTIGQLGERIGVISKHPYEEVIRSALELTGKHPTITAGVKIYDKNTDKNIGTLFQNAEYTVNAAVQAGGQRVAVLAGKSFDLDKFTPEEQAKIIPPSEVRKLIPEHQTTLKRR